MKNILFTTLILFLSFVTFAQELEADDFVVITQVNEAYPGFNARTYRGLFSVGHGQFKMFNYGGTPGNLSALGANQTLGSFVFNGYDGSSNVISAVIQAKTITNSRDARFNFLLSNGVGNQRPNRMTIIGQSGNVGIGMESPTERLDVAGNIRMRTGATAGYIPVSDANGKMTWTDPSTISTPSPWTESGSNVYRTGGRVGIGGAPSGRLHIRQDGTSISAGIRMTSFVNTTEDWYTYMNENDDFTFSDDGVDMLTLQNTTGNVGIGTDAPTATLTVETADESPLHLNVTSGTNNYMQFYVGGAYKGYAGVYSNNNDMDFGTGVFSTGSTHLVTNAIPRLTATVDGNVGIGTTAPTARLHIETDDTNTKAIEAIVNYVGNSDVSAISTNSTPAIGYGFGIYARGGYRGVYGVGAGTTATSSSFGIWGTASGSGGTRYGIYGSASGGTTNYAGYFQGDVTVTGTFSNPSDRKLKQNVESYTDALEIIQQLETKTYDYKKGKFAGMGLPSQPQIGFIAQEVEKVLPNLVRANVHPEEVEHDENGNRVIIREAINYKAINYIGLIPVLTQGIKELSITIKEKEEAIQKMETKLDATTKKVDELTAMLENMNDKFNQMEEDMSSCCLSGTDARTGSANTNLELNGSDVPTLEQNSPNPFYEQTVIKYYIPSVARTATMTITDMKGSPIKSVNLAGTGLGTVTINANELPVGTYIYTLFIDGNQVESKQMILVK